MPWSYTTKSGELTVTEWSTMFTLTYNQTGVSIVLGDGVDFNDFQVGTPQFYASLAEDIEYIEGYWIEYFESDFQGEYPHI